MKRLTWLLAMFLATGAKASPITGQFVPFKNWGVENGIARMAADGVYQVAIGLPVHQVYWTRADGSKLEIWHTGLFKGFDVDPRPNNAQNNSFGIFTGPKIGGPDLTPILDLPFNILINTLGVGQAWKPSNYFTVATSVVGFVGFRPTISGDFQHHLEYGGMILLNGKFAFADVLQIVKAGL